ncbi:MAG: (2Fe-2S)-binding protein [Ruminococcaceae bacterium]|nr:(2Fe-2S)-binding protein [Oscillospiraceae bacterium]
MENYTICNCKKVSYWDIEDALQKNSDFHDVLEAFEGVKAITQCSTGCGGCHDKVLDVISEIMMGGEKKDHSLKTHCNL